MIFIKLYYLMSGRTSNMPFFGPPTLLKGSYKFALVYLSVCLSIQHEISVTALTIFLIFSEMKEKNISRTITELNYRSKK